MATIIGFDPVTGEPIWDDPTLNPDQPAPLPTYDGGIQPAPPAAPVRIDTAVYMSSTQEPPEPDTMPNATHEGLSLTDRELFEVVEVARASAQWSFAKTVNVLLCVDDMAWDDCPVFTVDLSVTPINVSSARS